MLRVVEHYAGSDTGLQRRANEDSMLALSPLFVVADGMGGAQAGEVASRIAVEFFGQGIEDAPEPELALISIAQAANARIHELSHSNAEQAGMGTTLTAVYVGEEQVAIAHVGDSRAYCLRSGELLRLTDDHSLVDELVREGRLTPEEAIEHPQRSVITRALGPEVTVEVDTSSYRGRAGDVYLLCSDGLTTMVPEARLKEVLLSHRTLREAGEALIAVANEAGGRDNITVVLLRLGEVDRDTGVISEGAAWDPARHGAAERRGEASREGRGEGALEEHPRMRPRASVTPVRRRRPRRRTDGQGANGSRPKRRRRRLRRVGTLVVAVTLLGLIGCAAYLALQSVYFIGTNNRGLVTLFRGLPYQLPGNLALYSSEYVSGVSASTLSVARRHTLLDHSLRSEADAAGLIRDLELGTLE
jgi:protein phosphatase